MNSLITSAVSSGTSSVGKWLTASKRCTEYQGCSRATDSCAERNSGERGCAYTWRTGTGGLKVLNAWSGSVSRANIVEISRPPLDHISKPCVLVSFQICVATEAGASPTHVVTN